MNDNFVGFSTRLISFFSHLNSQYDKDNYKMLIVIIDILLNRCINMIMDRNCNKNPVASRVVSHLISFSRKLV